MSSPHLRALPGASESGRGGAGPLEGPIPSRWQHQELPAWRRVPPEVVCEVRFSHVDGRWLRQPATLLRWRPDRSPDDCGLEQLLFDHR